MPLGGGLDHLGRILFDGVRWDAKRRPGPRVGFRTDNGNLGSSPGELGREGGLKPEGRGIALSVILFCVGPRKRSDAFTRPGGYQKIPRIRRETKKSPKDCT